MNKKNFTITLVFAILLSASLVYAQAPATVAPPTAETEIAYVWENIPLFPEDMVERIESRQTIFRCVTGVNAGSALNVRSGPGTNHSVVGQFDPNTRVSFGVMDNLSTPAGWWWVRGMCRNQRIQISGYVSTDFLGFAEYSFSGGYFWCPA